ncbi:hypothetical protein ACXHXG_30385 [Rhizobium sp. LEGMi198b]
MADIIIRATINEDGFPTGFYTSDIWPEGYPESTVEIKIDEWKECLEHQGRRKFVAGQLVEYTPPPPVPTLADYTAAIAGMLDVKAKERLYDNALSISTYVGSSNAAWAAEAQAFVTWRDQIWAHSYTELDKVQAGERAQPTVSEFLAELETQFPLTWPDPAA